MSESKKLKVKSQKSKMRDSVVSEVKAIKEMKRIGVDPAGIGIMKDKAVFRIILLRDVRPALANIVKEDMLSAGGDAALHKLCCACKVEKTDVLLMGTIAQYKHVLNDLWRQPYGGRELSKRIESRLKII